MNNAVVIDAEVVEIVERNPRFPVCKPGKHLLKNPYCVVCINTAEFERRHRGRYTDDTMSKFQGSTMDEFKDFIDREIYAAFGIKPEDLRGK